MRRHRAAVHPNEQLAIRQEIQVLADCLRRHAEPIDQVLDMDLAGFSQQFKNPLLSDDYEFIHPGCR